MDIAGIKISTQKQIENRIEELECSGKFDEHIQPVDFSSMIPVTETYDFFPHTVLFRMWSAAVRFIASALGPLVTLFVMGARVQGRKNLHGVKGAVFICNHVHVLDNMVVRQAVFGRTLYITVAEFNNMKGLLGWIIRGAGTLPFSTNIKAMNNLQRTLSNLLGKGCAVLGYPEQSLWYRYEKPRPFHDGMFHIAVKNNVPVVPLFITFKKPSKFRSMFSRKKTAVLHILPPVYPLDSLSNRENVRYMMLESQKRCRECYTDFYGHAPVYLTRP